MAIAILPLMSVSEQILQDLEEELGNIFLSKIDILASLKSLPDDLYDKDRGQYDARKVVTHLKQASPGSEKTLAIGNMDLFVEGMNFVFGAAEKSGRTGLISLYRLDQRFYGKSSSYDLLSERAVKEAVHELGHIFGLDHCKNKWCVMAFSNDVVSVDQKTKFFCEDCRENVRAALCKS